MQVTILCVGKIKESFYTDAIQEYVKRMSRYAKVDIIEVSDEKTPDRASEAEETEIKRKEGERLLSRMKESMYVIALDLSGAEYDSLTFADHLADCVHGWPDPEVHAPVPLGRGAGLYRGFPADDGACSGNIDRSLSGIGLRDRAGLFCSCAHGSVSIGLQGPLSHHRADPDDSHHCHCAPFGAVDGL